MDLKRPFDRNNFIGRKKTFTPPSISGDSPFNASDDKDPMDTIYVPIEFILVHCQPVITSFGCRTDGVNQDRTGFLVRINASVEGELDHVLSNTFFCDQSQNGTDQYPTLGLTIIPNWDGSISQFRTDQCAKLGLDPFSKSDPYPKLGLLNIPNWD